MDARADAGDLFGRAALALPVRTAPSETERVRDYIRSGPARRLLHLVHDRARDKGGAADEQLCLPIAPPAASFIARLSRPYLDYGVYDSFRDLPAAAKAALRLEARGILHVGQLVQLHEQQVRALARTGAGAVEAMLQRLRSVGLRLGMQVQPASSYLLPGRRRQAR